VATDAVQPNPVRPPVRGRLVGKRSGQVDARRAHVILCWLALLLIQITETTTRATWPHVRDELDRIALCTFTGPAGTFRQRTELTNVARR
jgi:hypothetical protein